MKIKFDNFKQYIFDIENLLNKYFEYLSILIHLNYLNLASKIDFNKSDLDSLKEFLENVIQYILSFLLSVKYELNLNNFKNLKVEYNIVSFLKWYHQVLQYRYCIDTANFNFYYFDMKENKEYYEHVYIYASLIDIKDIEELNINYNKYFNNNNLNYMHIINKDAEIYIIKILNILKIFKNLNIINWLSWYLYVKENNMEKEIIDELILYKNLFISYFRKNFDYGYIENISIRNKYYKNNFNEYIKLKKKDFDLYKNYACNIQYLLNKYLYYYSYLVYLIDVHKIYNIDFINIEFIELKEFFINIIKYLINYFLSTQTIHIFPKIFKIKTDLCIPYIKIVEIEFYEYAKFLDLDYLNIKKNKNFYEHMYIYASLININNLNELNLDYNKYFDNDEVFDYTLYLNIDIKGYLMNILNSLNKIKSYDNDIKFDPLFVILNTYDINSVMTDVLYKESSLFFRHFNNYWGTNTNTNGTFLNKNTQTYFNRFIKDKCEKK
jgi:hypothetical protein